MVALFKQTLKAVAGRIIPQALRTDTSAAPMTDTNFYVLKGYYQMWSHSWGCTMPGMDITNRIIGQEAAHVD